MSERLLDRRQVLKGLGALGLAAIAPAFVDFKLAEANLPTELPPHITYHERAVSKYIEGSARIVRPLLPGDIWLAQAQKIRVMGVDYDIRPEENPGRAMVFAIGAATHLDLDFTTVNGVYVWSGLESTQRISGGFVEDIATAGQVQVSRAQIPGNCIPTGCGEVTLVMAVGHRDADGVVRFDAIPHELFRK